jgi:hypothetical protein
MLFRLKLTTGASYVNHGLITAVKSNEGVTSGLTSTVQHCISIASYCSSEVHRFRNQDSNHRCLDPKRTHCTSVDLEILDEAAHASTGKK